LLIAIEKTAEAIANATIEMPKLISILRSQVLIANLDGAQALYTQLEIVRTGPNHELDPEQSEL